MSGWLGKYLVLPGFYLVLYLVYYHAFYQVFPRFQIPGSPDFQWPPVHFPRILRSPSSRNPRFPVRPSASRATWVFTWFLPCLLHGFTRFSQCYNHRPLPHMHCLEDFCNYICFSLRSKCSRCCPSAGTYCGMGDVWVCGRNVQDPKQVPMIL